MALSGILQGYLNQIRQEQSSVTSTGPYRTDYDGGVNIAGRYPNDNAGPDVRAGKESFNRQEYGSDPYTYEEDNPYIQGDERGGRTKLRTTNRYDVSERRENRNKREHKSNEMRVQRGNADRSMEQSRLDSAIQSALDKRDKEWQDKLNAQPKFDPDAMRATFDSWYAEANPQKETKPSIVNQAVRRTVEKRKAAAYRPISRERTIPRERKDANQRYTAHRSPTQGRGIGYHNHQGTVRLNPESARRRRIRGRKY